MDQTIAASAIGHAAALTSKFNEMLTNFDPSTESRTLQEQVAASRHLSAGAASATSFSNVANSTAISNAPAPPLPNPLASSVVRHHASLAVDSLTNANRLKPSSFIDDSALSNNISLAFNNYRPTRPSISSMLIAFFAAFFYLCLFDVCFYSPALNAKLIPNYILYLV